MIALILWAFLLLPVSGLDFLKAYDRRDIPTGFLYSRGWHDDAVRWAEIFLPKALSRIEARLGRQLEGRFKTILVGDFAEFDRVYQQITGRRTAPDRYTQGVAFPSLRLIVVRGDLVRGPTFEDPAAVTLTHEVAHIVLHRFPDTKIPRWLDEGMAVWVSGGRLTPRDEAYLSLLARTSSLYRFETLETEFPPGHLPTTTAYKQSYLMIRFLQSVYGEQAPIELLDLLESGETTGHALEAITSLSLEQLEEDFFRWTRARRSFLESLVLVVNLWTVVALLALVAIARYLLKRRRLLRKLEEEEGPALPASPPAA